ncbi:MAG: BofC C-terminal domain-containing protein [Sporomusaceae bacterium]|nr:BofC C-terminal domain-containing protein [Sporomusaceae bacterium]
MFWRLRNKFLPPGQKMRALLAGASCVIFLGLIWNYFGYDNSIKMSESKAAQQNGKIKITAATKITQKILYLKCWSEEVAELEPTPLLIGLNYNQLQKLYPDWQIENFDENEVALTSEIDSMCREHTNNTFIGVKDGYVAVFHGVPGPNAILKEMTNISLDKVMLEDLKEISSGLKVNSKEELLITLEGMQER